MNTTNRRLVAALAAVLVFSLVPVAVFAAGHTFTDDDTSIFEADIEWLASADVTKGCNPPTNDKFCPDDPVTRGQMAAFMRRFAQYLGAEDGTPGEADNADTVDGLHASAFATDGHDHTGADIVDESITGADIDDHSVSNLDTSNEPGVVFNNDPDPVSATTTPTAMVSTSIRVPSDGWVVIEVSGHWRNSSTNSVVYCQLQKGEPAAISPSTADPWLYLNANGESPRWTHFSAHRVMPIAVADNPAFITGGQALSFVCDEFSGDTSFDDLHISGTFFATGYAPISIIPFP